MKILIQEDKDIEKAHYLYTQFTQDEKLIELYEAREKFRKDYNSALADAEEKGIEKGIEIDKLDIARKMKAQNIDIEIIIRCTGLSRETIQNL